MVFVGGISRRQKILDYVKTVMRDRCGEYRRYQVYMTYMYFSFFFIPLFKWNKRFYIEMSCYDAVYELDPEMGKALFHDQQADIKSSDLTLVREERHRGYYDSGIYKTWKKCGNCGHGIEEDFKYCPKCDRRPQRAAVRGQQQERNQQPLLI